MFSCDLIDAVLISSFQLLLTFQQRYNTVLNTALRLKPFSLIHILFLLPPYGQKPKLTAQ